MKPSDALEPGSAYVFKLGPLGEGRERASAYVAFTAGGPPLAPIIAGGDARALALLAPRLSGQRVQCEPRLARAGARHGFTAAPVPEPLVAVRAGLALSVLWEPGLADPRPGLVAPLLEASALLWQQAPWRRWTNVESFTVHVEGGLREEREGCLLGSGLQEFGFALYEEKGAVARVSRLMAEGREAEAEQLGAVALTFEQTPAWVRSAVRDATGLPRFPLPLCVEEGRIGLLGPTELVLLTATARALAQVTPEQRQASGHAAFEAIRLTAHVQLPPPRRRRPEEPSAGRRRRPAAHGGPLRGHALGPPRVSEALLRFAQPLLTQLPDAPVDEEDLSELLLFAMTAWNAVVLEAAGEQPSAVAALRAQLATLPPEERAFLLPHFDVLVRRKRRHFPGDLRLMEALEVSRRPDGDLAVRVLARQAGGSWQPEAP